MTASRTAVGGVPAGKVQQDCVPARALDQGPDRRAVGLAGDQIAFPVPGDLTVGRLFWPLVDHGHVGQATAALFATTMRLAAQPAGTQCLGQLPAQATEVRTVDRLVNGLRHDVTLGLARELGSNSACDLLWAPPPLEPALHEHAQLNVGNELARLRPCPPLLGQPLRRVRTVHTALRIEVAAQFPTHRRRDRGPARGRSPELLHQHGEGQRSEPARPRTGIVPRSPACPLHRPQAHSAAADRCCW